MQPFFRVFLSERAMGWDEKGLYLIRARFIYVCMCYVCIHECSITLQSSVQCLESGGIIVQI